MQEAIVEAAMRGEAVLAILPTGTGKSVCYQIPALSRYEKTGALTVVISPLVALMADQVAGLQARAADAQTIERLTFQEAIVRAVQNNPSIAQAAQGILRAESILQQVRSSSLPAVGVNFTVNVLLSPGASVNGASAPRLPSNWPR